MMRVKYISSSGIIIASLGLLLNWSCKKDNCLAQEAKGFILSSSEIGADSLLPAEYTCDGVSSTLPLTWSGAPENTVCFALIMHHTTSPTDIHCYWIVYNIPAVISSLSKNVSGIGILGTNSLNDKTGYSPPCSQGPGIKAYTYTVYALSQEPILPVTPDKLTREILLNAIEDITLASAKMTVYYSRNI